MLLILMLYSAAIGIFLWAAIYADRSQKPLPEYRGKTIQSAEHGPAGLVLHFTDGTMVRVNGGQRGGESLQDH